MSEWVFGRFIPIPRYYAKPLADAVAGSHAWTCAHMYAQCQLSFAAALALASAAALLAFRALDDWIE